MQINYEFFQGLLQVFEEKELKWHMCPYSIIVEFAQKVWYITHAERAFGCGQNLSPLNNFEIKIEDDLQIAYSHLPEGLSPFEAFFWAIVKYGLLKPKIVQIQKINKENEEREWERVREDQERRSKIKPSIYLSDAEEDGPHSVGYWY